MAHVEFDVRPMGDGRWEVVGGEADVSASFDDKLDAVAYARDLAMRRGDSVVMIRDEAGSIEAEHNYSLDHPDA